jgi:hypothetical protein
LDLLKAQQECGMHYLGEGIHKFELRDGMRLKVYANSSTSEFDGYAFGQTEGEDSFNATASAISRVIDIVITYGPPAFP